MATDSLTASNANISAWTTRLLQMEPNTTSATVSEDTARQSSESSSPRLRELKRSKDRIKLLTHERDAGCSVFDRHKKEIAELEHKVDKHGTDLLNAE